jgi:hypothetical protein
MPTHTVEVNKLHRGVQTGERLSTTGVLEPQRGHRKPRLFKV